MGNRGLGVAAMGAMVIGLLATDAVVRRARGQCMDLEPFEPTLGGPHVVVERAGPRIERSFGDFEHELGPVTLFCHEDSLGGNDAHEMRYDVCVVRPRVSCHKTHGSSTSPPFRATEAVLEHDPLSKTFVVRAPLGSGSNVGTSSFRLVAGEPSHTIWLPLAGIWSALAIAFSALLRLRRTARVLATFLEGTVEENGRVRPNDGGPPFAAAPHAFAIGAEIMFAAPPKEPSYRSEEAVLLSPSRKEHERREKALRFWAWLAILAALLGSAALVFLVR